MTTPSPLFYLTFALSALIIGMGKGGLGVAFAALATPLMALVLPVDQVLALVLVLQMFTDVFAVGAHWKRWDRRLVVILIPGALVGVAVGTLFITSVSPQALRTTLAVVILLFTVYKLVERRLLRGVVYHPRNWHSLVAGGISGFTSAVANNGGPPVTIYLLMHNLQPRAFIATTALFFMILNYIKVPFYLAADLFDWPLLRSVLWLLPLAPIGVWIGKAFVLRVNKELYDRVILLFLVLSALLVLLT
ncbi:MAG TPA: sulfite exporter TauE/SafE family protein [Anaerolineae bacterium]|nr:sulfite exporter TauE/SafE family protein [Anaerolineae bacterium]